MTQTNHKIVLNLGSFSWLYWKKYLDIAVHNNFLGLWYWIEILKCVWFDWATHSNAQIKDHVGSGLGFDGPLTIRSLETQCISWIVDYMMAWFLISLSLFYKKILSSSWHMCFLSIIKFLLLSAWHHYQWCCKSPDECCYLPFIEVREATH
jgi:hypothetical protein